MKKLNILTFLAVALFLTACGEIETIKEQQAAEKTGKISAANLETSKIGWKAFHKGGVFPRWGTLTLRSGELSVKNGELTAGDFTMNMQSIQVDPGSVTEEGAQYLQLEAHLKNADFFDVEKYPTADFKITKVTSLEPNDKATIEGANKMVSGNLTLKGKALNVTFPAKVTIIDGIVTVQAKFTVNRTDWNINFATSEADPAEWLISKDLEISIDVKTIKNI
ncbi:hypothetical protein DBR11_13575 [Pedobacter sp. HMWF019]|uniref:YceI family protein n=1 Tax=Pedobacter sp. HMWF019 TaxID=2056856 RepID=UPI000D35044F|nr:YceI family protein [Pedobacter sp. HMWF019]PTS98999.1 hypothetical protein DBR11_13575 [Pedobacter sp. HMWF019]